MLQVSNKYLSINNLNHHKMETTETKTRKLASIEAMTRKLAANYSGEPLKKLIKFGNKKLPDTTAIFNLGPAKICPSMLLGLCEIVKKYGLKKCYAYKAEKQYKTPYAYRLRQAQYWLATDAETFAAEFIAIWKRKKVKPTLLRVNESGDFWTQNCIVKLHKIARIIYKETGVKTYAYSARKDLNFSYTSLGKDKFINFVFSFNTFNTGAIGAEFKAVNAETFAHIESEKEQHNRNAKLPQDRKFTCIADCTKCNLCAVVNSGAIYAKLH
jgi:hypothetical protein